MTETIATMPSAASPGMSARGVPAAMSRPDWVALLARITDGFVRSVPVGGSPARALLPGADPSEPVTSIEGFARMSVAWGAWLSAESNPRTLIHAGRQVDVAALLAQGLTDATDPRHPAWWGPIGDRDQRIVEAAEIATALWLGGERLQAELRLVDPAAGDRILDWLELVDGRDLWPDNWVLFPVLPALLRQAAGRAIPAGLIDGAIDWMNDHAAGDGWYRDGAGHALDLYTGWAIHWHLLWWATIDGAHRPARRRAVIRRARAWLAGVAPLVAADGGFPRFGRSLGYRFALAAPFVQGALLGIDPLEPGAARRLAGAVVGRALDDGAIDPATDWFQIGVGGRKPEVVEGYVSAGASAWAAHAFLALAMPQKHPFWSAGPSALDAGPRPSGCLASADAGILATWSGTTRETRLHNARIGHPADIADHDYAATYGKLAYRSAFPFDLPTTAAGQAGADGAVVVIEGSGHVIHRNESVAGAAGPGWIRTRSLLPTTGAPTELTTVVLVLNPLEIRVTRVRPGVPVRLRESPATLGFAAADARDVRVGTNADGAWVADSDRTIAVRALLGYDVAGHAGARAGLANLVHERSITPFVEESASSAAPRVVAAVGVAVSRAVAPDLALAGVRLEARGSNVTIAWPGGAAFVAVGRAPERRITLGGLEFEGRRLHVLRVDRDHTTIMGERIAAITGVVTLDRPGAVSLTRDESGVEVTAASGVRLDQGWAGPGLIRCLTRLGVGAWQPAADLAEPGVVPDRLVRRIARAHGTRLVDLRLERAG